MDKDGPSSGSGKKGLNADGFMQMADYASSSFLSQSLTFPSTA